VFVDGMCFFSSQNTIICRTKHAFDMTFICIFVAS
jgi:hypothetical protein